jgi:hypothetical protein
MTEDDWRWHAYDTIKGSDWLGDQDAIQMMCRCVRAFCYSSIACVVQTVAAWHGLAWGQAQGYAWSNMIEEMKHQLQQ